VTKHTYSISLFSKISLLCAMIVWCMLDVQTVLKEGLSNYLPTLISDGFTTLWTCIFIGFKIKYK
jgi:uncharacterized protein with PQ loop repeat